MFELLTSSSSCTTRWHNCRVVCQRAAQRTQVFVVTGSSGCTDVLVVNEHWAAVRTVSKNAAVAVAAAVAAVAVAAAVCVLHTAHACNSSAYMFIEEHQQHTRATSFLQRFNCTQSLTYVVVRNSSSTVFHRFYQRLLNVSTSTDAVGASVLAPRQEAA